MKKGKPRGTAVFLFLESLISLQMHATITSVFTRAQHEVVE